MKSILAIFGGNSTEHDISIITAVEALSSVPYTDYKVYPAYIKDGVWYTSDKLFDIASFRDFKAKSHKKITLIGRELLYQKGKKWKHLDDIDCALMLTHGGEGERGELEGYLELQGIPYTTADSSALALCMDKYLTKLAVVDMGYDVVEGALVGDNCVESAQIVAKKLGYPMFIKPNGQGSSIGVGYARDELELLEKIEVALSYDRYALVERGIEHFTEYNCAVLSLGDKIVISEVERPLTAHDFLSFEDKYIAFTKGENNVKREFPANISEELKTQIRQTAGDIFLKFNLKGVVRFDFIYDGTLYLNEINSIPGSLAHYLFPEYSYSTFLSLLIDDAIDRGNHKSVSFKSNVLNIGGSKN